MRPPSDGSDSLVASFVLPHVQIPEVQIAGIFRMVCDQPALLDSGEMDRILPNLNAVYPRRPFTTAPTSRIMAMQWVIPVDDSEDWNAHDTTLHPFELVVPLTVFTDPSFLSHPSKIIPWDKWGPQHTRMRILSPSINNLMCYTYGNRMVSITADDSDIIDVRVADYNPLRHALPNSREPENVSYRSAQDINIVEDDEVFENKQIQTAAPYWVSTRELAESEVDFDDGFGVMCDEERIIRFRVSSLSQHHLDVES